MKTFIPLLLSLAPLVSGFAPSTRHAAITRAPLSTSTVVTRATASTHEEDIELTRKVIIDYMAATDVGSDSVVDDDDDDDTTEAPIAPPQAAEKPKKKKKKSPPPVVEAGPVDISKLNIIVGVITKAWEHETADKLFCEEIDVGEAEPRQIATGVRAHYNAEDMVGRKVCILANLKSRKLMGFPSHGMVLCASTEDGSTVKFVEAPEDAVVGERIMVEGFEGEPATENQVVKKKMLDAIFPDLRTDENGVASYKGVALTAGTGKCVAEGGLADASVS
eukprot:CAMPEP_0201909040 /NCGR_PEP_ID=MMETSP0903-20130614/946_1 /ASSEMBLY_ACC=CAM_ASM_000552 /TAXON_ID=420261 /ORGANISM="Thalassiosira antarctica, Strain CCMP982" /LENGTH=276 /DNA_ID=CAMNT_0048443495 /DNA_START=33 /DNA_END=863 /DNA_ORIENTATION=+